MRDHEGNHTITDIALAHGFGDSARFSHAFKDRFGKAPSLWRSHHNGG